MMRCCAYLGVLSNEGVPMNYIANFFTGLLLCNCIPHLSAGLQGKSFQTPFARPRGVGESPALINFLWGMANFLVGAGLLQVFPIAVGGNLAFVTATAGALCLGCYLSMHFAKVRHT